MYSFAACEKDDICVDGDTPLLVIRFYDVADTTLLKSVSGLVVSGLASDGSVVGVIPNAGTDSIAIPLRIGEASTSFILSRNLTPDDETTENMDTLAFDYETQEVFISRACGFVANYNNLTNTLTTDSDNWIQDITIVTPSVENSTTAHVKIFH